MTTAETRLKIRYFGINHLHPDPRQRRKYTRKQIQHLKGSIEAFGFSVPSVTGRHCHQTELLRRVDRMIGRSRNLPGNAARHAESVRSFDYLARWAEVRNGRR